MLSESRSSLGTVNRRSAPRCAGSWLLAAGLIASLLVVLTGCAQETFESQGEWPEFRGLGGHGLVAEGITLPTVWGPDSENIRWRAPVDGVGNSSPIVVDGQVLVTVADPTPEALKKKGNAPSRDPGKKVAEGPDLRRSVISYDLQTGELRWRTNVFSAPPEKGHFLSTNAAPTPLTNGTHVWVYFGQYLAKLTTDGELVWVRDVDPTYSHHIRYGASSSPIFAGGLIVLYQDREWADTPDVGWMAAFDPETGDEVWRNTWSHTCCAYTTPSVWRRGGGAEELLMAESAELVSYDPATGERLWVGLHGQLQTVSSLNIVDDEVVCALGGAHHDKGNTCFRVTGSGDAVEVEQLWDIKRRAPESGSPIYYQGRLWALTDAGVMSSYDPYTGKVHWVRRLKKGRDYRSSLIAGDGKIYAQSTYYMTAVIDATAKDLEVLSYNESPEGGNNATPAVGGGCLILRTHDHLYCIEPEAEADMAAAS